jgi:mannose-6-phosphate isomerase
MPELYPLLLLPEFKERVWGTRDLSLLYPHKTARQGGEFEQLIGEVWLTGDDCRVANGALAGQTLAAVTQRFGRELIGEAAPDAARFPLLIKFLFPKERLSVQVHPDDAAARAVGMPNGKSECWYVLAAEPGAEVALGLRPGVTRAEVERAIAEIRLESLLHWVSLRPGDMIYVDAGTIHAIGPGAVLVETQQNSDTTYRLYDYGRPRELHVAQGLAAMKETTSAGKAPRREGGSVNHLIATPHFAVDKIVVKTPVTVPALLGRSSCQVLVALDGCGVVEAGGMRPVTFAKGECVVLPAGVGEVRLQPQWALECLRAWVPGEPVPEPATTR